MSRLQQQTRVKNFLLFRLRGMLTMIPVLRVFVPYHADGIESGIQTCLKRVSTMPAYDVEKRLRLDYRGDVLVAAGYSKKQVQGYRNVLKGYINACTNGSEVVVDLTTAQKIVEILDTYQEP